MIDALDFMLFPLIVLVAIYKRTEMALWLMLVSGAGMMAMYSDIKSNDYMIMFFCACNMILMYIGFENWRRTKLSLPLFIGLLASFDVVCNFIHLLYMINTGVVSYSIGVVTGVIAYAQLILVSTMKDSKGVMHDMLKDTGLMFYSLLRLGSSNKHKERS